MENLILGVFGGNAELPSSLELVQAIHDEMSTCEELLEHPLNKDTLVSYLEKVIENWKNRRGISVKLSGEELQALIADVDQHWSPDEHEVFFKRLDQSYEPFRKPPATETKNTRSKSKKAATAETEN
jgi:CRISPR-associated protein Csc2